MPRMVSVFRVTGDREREVRKDVLPVVRLRAAAKAARRATEDREKQVRKGVLTGRTVTDGLLIIRARAVRRDARTVRARAVRKDARTVRARAVRKDVRTARARAVRKGVRTARAVRKGVHTARARARRPYGQGQGGQERRPYGQSQGGQERRPYGQGQGGQERRSFGQNTGRDQGGQERRQFGQGQGIGRGTRPGGASRPSASADGALVHKTTRDYRKDGGKDYDRNKEERRENGKHSQYGSASSKPNQGKKQFSRIPKALQQNKPKNEAPKEKEVVTEIKIPEKLTVRELAEAMKMQPAALVKDLFMKGMMVTVNHELPFEKAAEIAMEYDIIAEQEEKEDVIAASWDMLITARHPCSTRSEILM